MNTFGQANLSTIMRLEEMGILGKEGFLSNGRR